LRIVAVLTEVEPDKVEHSRDDRNEYCTLHTATEINFGLHSAGSERLVRHRRHGRRFVYLKHAAYESTAKRGISAAETQQMQ